MKTYRSVVFRPALLLLLIFAPLYFVAGLKVGVGRADCTGPPVEITFMGYAEMKQRGVGVHLRQFARTFVVEDEHSKHVAFVSVDAAMMGHAVKRTVVERLRERLGPIYTMENVVISGTHTHSTPGGFLMQLLYDMPSLGFVRATFAALVTGITESVLRAHGNLQEARIYVAETEVEEASINRSPSAYENNPAEEKAEYESNVDKMLTQLRFENAHGQIFGVFNWFAVHPVSMNNTNRFLSSDNVGYASVLLETELNGDALVGQGEIVGAFASSNLGDVSPNIKGPKCERTGLECDILTSKCPSDDLCFASGPGKNMFESTKIIAGRIYEKASELLRAKKGKEVTGSIRFVHQYIDMPTQAVHEQNSTTGEETTVTGCLPAMGYSFAAGTTDGPGMFSFEQGTKTENPLWNAVRDFIAPPTEEDKECQKPKPILLATGRATFPYEWQPRIVPTQIITIGDLAILALPGEFTTMAGRRMRKAVRAAAGRTIDVILAGLSNIYTSYITTPEEYQIQRYEGASTLYGPHTLTIYLEQYRKLTKALYLREKIDAGPTPPDLDDKQISLAPPVIYDGHPINGGYGYVVQPPEPRYRRTDTVVVKFQAGNPRNNHMLEGTFFTVERLEEGDTWKVVATDANWETMFSWQRTSTIFGWSEITFFWTIPGETKTGEYRIRHFGHYRYILGGTFPYSGSTSAFMVE